MLVVAGLLGVWFLLTVLSQFEYFFRIIVRFDRFRLVPRWAFFAPNPGHHDYHLVYRGRRADNSLTEWEELTDVNCGQNLSCVWNPQRRVVKTISDIVKMVSLMRKHHEVPSQYLQFTLPYMLLLHFVQARGGADIERQFAIVRTEGFAELRPTKLDVILLSEFHPIESGNASGAFP
jgi:hypothetical protein